MMTTNVYVTSTQTFSGKTALCVGLLGRFKRDGFHVGYIKPVSTTARIVGDQVMDEDAHFVKDTFDLAESLETMAPVILTDQRVGAILAGEDENLDAHVQSAYRTIAQDKDIVVLDWPRLRWPSCWRHKRWCWCPTTTICNWWTT
jgi:BioD-like phosphotransacetylase family protein